MVIFLQFTLTDIRSLSQGISEVLNKPEWPLPMLSQFVRGTGRIRLRRKKGLRSWVHEGYLCEIKKGIGNPEIHNSTGIPIKNVYRNFYSGEEQILNRYEFVFRSDNKKDTLKIADIKSVLAKILDAEVKLRFGVQRITTPIASLGKNLKNFHRANTTFKARLSEEESINNIIPCTPQIYILLDEGEHFEETQSSLEKISQDADAYRLFTQSLDFKDRELRLWVHEQKTADMDIHRNLRISIQRIFSEHNCLKNVFAAISSNRIAIESHSPKSDKLQRYFNTAISSYLKAEKDLNSDSEMTGFSDKFSKLFDNFQPGELKVLREKIINSNLRPAIINKTENFMNNTFNNTQIGIVGDGAKIDNLTFNQQSNTLPENTDYLALANELKKLTDYLSGEATTEAQKTEVATISNAQIAAAKNDGRGVVHYLKEGGKWAFDTAVKIGVTVAAAAIKEQAGIH